MGMLQVVLPVIVMLAIGTLCREKKLINDAGVESLQSIVMNFTLPAVLFANFYKNSIALDTILFPLVLFILTAGGIYLGKFVCKIAKEDDQSLPFMLTGYEAGMLGYTLLTLLVGADNLSTFAVMDVGHCLAIFTVYIAMVKNVGGEKQSLKDSLMGVVKTPVLMAVFFGMIFGVAGIGQFLATTSVGPLIDTVCSFISAPTSAMILIVIGYRMKFKGINMSKIIKAIIMRIVMQVALFFIVLVLFKSLGGVFAEPFTILSMGIMLLLPPPYVLPLYISGEERKEFYSSALSVYTAITIVGFIIIAGVMYM